MDDQVVVLIASLMYLHWEANHMEIQVGRLRNIHCESSHLVHKLEPRWVLLLVAQVVLYMASLRVLHWEMPLVQDTEVWEVILV